MKQLPKSTAKDVFLHVLAIGTLYVSVISFITLCFEYVNVTWPDALDYSLLGSLESIRGAMAALFVIFPVFIATSWFMRKDAREEKEKREIGIRKWLLYLTLLITAIVMMADVVTLVNFFLNGEITVRFLLKVLIALVTAASVFSYYLWDLRHDMKEKTMIPKKSAIASSIIAVASIVLGFVLVGSPMHQRLVRFDETRVQDLSMIQSQITNYYSLKQVLPASLADLENPLMGFTVPVDPNTGASFEYSVKSPLSFELCATFDAASPGGAKDFSRPYGVYAPYNESWTHDDQRTCFTRTIDPALYPAPNGVIVK